MESAKRPDPRWQPKRARYRPTPLNIASAHQSMACRLGRCNVESQRIWQKLEADRVARDAKGFSGNEKSLILKCADPWCTCSCHGPSTAAVAAYAEYRQREVYRWMAANQHDARPSRVRLGAILLYAMAAPCVLIALCVLWALI